jgi:hypothetical protein
LLRVAYTALKAHEARAARERPATKDEPPSDATTSHEPK